jgi:type IV fimbrial biogenesis protein FimT
LVGSPRASRGVTLVELLTVITIAAILMGIGVPSYRYVTNTNRTAGEVNALLGDLQFARGEAIKEGQTVTACVSTDGATCAGTTAWQSGWIVFSDVNNDQTVDPGDTVFRVQPAFTTVGSSDTFNADNGVSAVTFSREGFATNVAVSSLITLYTSPQDSRWTRCVSISNVGMVATARYGVATPGGNCT